MEARDIIDSGMRQKVGSFDNMISYMNTIIHWILTTTQSITLLSFAVLAWTKITSDQNLSDCVTASIVSTPNRVTCRRLRRLSVTEGFVGNCLCCVRKTPDLGVAPAEWVFTRSNIFYWKANTLSRQMGDIPNGSARFIRTATSTSVRI